MKFFVHSKINLLLLGFLAVILVGGGSVNADFIFGTPTNLGLPINSSYDEGWPNISADDLSVFFSSDRPGGSGHGDIWVAGRPNTSDPWGTPVNLGPNVNSSDLGFLTTGEEKTLPLRMPSGLTCQKGGKRCTDL